MPKDMEQQQPQQHIAVVVLGDVGRSPRMQYHAVSLADRARTRRVTLIGYAGERCVPAVETHPKIAQQLMQPVEARWLRRAVPFPVYAALKVLLLFWRLALELAWRTPGPLDAVLVQTPPALPTLIVAWLVCRARGAELVVDWHNLGYTVLAFALGKPNDSRHPAVRAPRAAETWLARRADAHFCVTHAMAAFLRAEMAIGARVTPLHDRPPRFFTRTGVEAQHDLFVRLSDELAWPFALPDAPRDALSATALTVRRQRGGRTVVEPREGRPALVVSSTSWSADEDFSVLLDALVAYDSIVDAPALLCVVTGKGPQKAMYLERIRALTFARVAIRTVWLEPGDYPVLLGCADLGVCLHTSPSGLDLPMKVLDMFGCGVPVCALGFGCIGELVRDRENGRTFASAAELADQLVALLSGFPRAAELASLRRGVGEMARWEENWTALAAPVFDALGRRS